MGLEVRGVTEMEQQLRAMVDRADTDARWASEAMAVVVTNATKDALARSEHAPGTPTPSAPGTPPSRISGALQSSVGTTGRMSWPGRASTRVAPTAVQARIQELGGWTGRGHATHLPPRPYLRPTLERYTDEIRDAAIEQFAAVLDGS